MISYNLTRMFSIVGFENISGVQENIERENCFIFLVFKNDISHTIKTLKLVIFAYIFLEFETLL